jgi:hypothetical protein
MADDTTPQGPGLLQQLVAGLVPGLVPAAVVGVGSALAAPSGSSAGQAVGRGMLGAMAGYQSAQPTQRDLYYKDRLAFSQLQRQKLEADMADKAKWAKSLEALPEEDRLLASADPKAYVDHVMAQREKKLNVPLLSKVFGVSEDDLAGMDPKTVNKLTADVMEWDFKNKHQPAQLSVVDAPYTTPEGAEHPGWALFDKTSKQLVGPPHPKNPTHARDEKAINLRNLRSARTQLLKNLKGDPALDAINRQEIERLDAEESTLTGKPSPARPWPALPEPPAKNTGILSGLAGKVMSALSPAGPTATPAATPAPQMPPAAPVAGAPPAAAPPQMAPTPTGQLPKTVLNPGVKLNADDEIYTDGKTVFRARPGQGPTPQEIAELGLTRVK